MLLEVSQREKRNKREVGEGRKIQGREAKGGTYCFIKLSQSPLCSTSEEWSDFLMREMQRSTFWAASDAHRLVRCRAALSHDDSFIWLHFESESGIVCVHQSLAADHHLPSTPVKELPGDEELESAQRCAWGGMCWSAGRFKKHCFDSNTRRKLNVLMCFKLSVHGSFKEYLKQRKPLTL